MAQYPVGLILHFPWSIVGRKMTASCVRCLGYHEYCPGDRLHLRSWCPSTNDVEHGCIRASKLPKVGKGSQGPKLRARPKMRLSDWLAFEIGWCWIASGEA